MTIPGLLGSYLIDGGSLDREVLQQLHWPGGRPSSLMMETSPAASMEQ